MNLFYFITLLSPLFVGLGILAILAGFKKSIYYLAGFLVTVFLGLFTISLISAEIAKLPSVFLLLITFVLPIFCIFRFFISLGFAVVLSQVITSILVILCVGSCFYLNPIIEILELHGSSSAEIANWINTFLKINPYVVSANSIFGIDCMKFPIIYNKSLASNYLFTYPTLFDTVLLYLITSVLSIFLYFLITIFKTRLILVRKFHNLTK